MSGVHCNVLISSTSDYAMCTLLDSAVKSTVIQYLYFKPRMSSMTRKKKKKSYYPDITGSFL